jgi:hypothetical protein
MSGFMAAEREHVELTIFGKDFELAVGVWLKL